MNLDKKLIEKFSDITSNAAIACSKYIGKNNKIAADKAATDAMRKSLNKLDINGWKINTFTFSLVLLWLTGLVWISLQLMGSPEAFIRPYLLTLHGLLIAPLFIGLGGLWAAHMPKGWKPEKKKLSGLSLIFFLCFLSVSGLLLYYLGPIYLKDLTSMFHTILGLILVPLVFWHYSKRKLS